MSESVNLSSIPFALLCTDLNGIVTDCNAQMSCLSGYSREQLIDESVELLLPEYMVDSHISSRKSHIRGSGILSLTQGMFY